MGEIGLVSTPVSEPVSFSSDAILLRSDLVNSRKIWVQDFKERAGDLECFQVWKGMLLCIYAPRRHEGIKTLPRKPSNSYPVTNFNKFTA